MINESNMMHGMDYNRQDVSGWLMSEKLNGCRAFWDGAVMWTRGGKVIAVPDYMRDLLPDFSLDGEIHAGRGGFEIARKAVQYGRFTPECQFSAFDAPDHPGIFCNRYKFLSNRLCAAGPVNFLQHYICHDFSGAVVFLRHVHCLGGEGVMLRNPANLYQPGRSNDLLKLKFWDE